MRPVFVTIALVLAAAGRLMAQQDTTPKWYDRIRFEGDFRLRHESFFAEGAPSRGRLRIRARAGFTLPISRTVTSGLRLASGEPGVVTSSNVSLTGSLVPKSMVLDRAFLTWTPSSHFTITGGKFALPLIRNPGLFRSELIYDEDLAPEGLHELVTLVQRKTGLLRRLAVLGEQWTLQELGDRPDTWMLGGQAVADLALSSRTTATIAGAYHGFLHGRTLAEARNSNSALFVSNSVVLRDGTVVPGGKGLAPPSGNPFATFLNDFELISGTAGLSIDRVFGRMPLQAYVDVVHNAGASAENTGYWASLSAGTLRRRGDWAATVVYARVPTEAVLSMYSYSDLGFGGTNSKGPMLQVQYRPGKDFTLSIRDHVMSAVNAATAVANTTLHRLQVDASVAF